MYTPGQLIYFDPFLFKDGSSKPKYFVVLKRINDQVVLASLPSSQAHLPANHSYTHGCLEMPESGINCYVFEAGRPVTKSGWSFPLDTFLYGMWIDEFNTETLKANHPIENVDYEIIGELTDDELRGIIDCFRNSATVKRKYRRLLD